MARTKATKEEYFAAARQLVREVIPDDVEIGSHESYVEDWATAMNQTPWGPQYDPDFLNDAVITIMEQEKAKKQPPVLGGLITAKVASTGTWTNAQEPTPEEIQAVKATIAFLQSDPSPWYLIKWNGYAGDEGTFEMVGVAAEPTSINDFAQAFGEDPYDVALASSDGYYTYATKEMVLAFENLSLTNPPETYGARNDEQYFLDATNMPDFEELYSEEDEDEEGIEASAKTADGVDEVSQANAQVDTSLIQMADTQPQTIAPKNASSDYDYKTEFVTPDGYEVQSYSPMADPKNARRFTVWPPEGNAVGDYTSLEEAQTAIEQWKQFGNPALLKRDGGANFKIKASGPIADRGEILQKMQEGWQLQRNIGMTPFLFRHTGGGQGIERIEVDPKVLNGMIRRKMFNVVRTTHGSDPVWFYELKTAKDSHDDSTECASGLTLRQVAEQAQEIYSNYQEGAEAGRGYDAGEFSGPASARSADREVMNLCDANGFGFTEVLAEMNRIDDADYDISMADSQSAVTASDEYELTLNDDKDLDVANEYGGQGQFQRGETVLHSPSKGTYRKKTGATEGHLEQIFDMFEEIFRDYLENDPDFRGKSEEELMKVVRNEGEDTFASSAAYEMNIPLSETRAAFKAWTGKTAATDDDNGGRYNPAEGEEQVFADWKDTEGLIEGFRTALDKLGIEMVDHPDTEGSDTYGFILRRKGGKTAAKKERDKFYELSHYAGQKTVSEVESVGTIRKWLSNPALNDDAPVHFSMDGQELTIDEAYKTKEEGGFVFTFMRGTPKTSRLNPGTGSNFTLDLMEAVETIQNAMKKLQNKDLQGAHDELYAAQSKLQDKINEMGTEEESHKAAAADPYQQNKMRKVVWDAMINGGVTKEELIETFTQLCDEAEKKESDLLLGGSHEATMSESGYEVVVLPDQGGTTLEVLSSRLKQLPNRPGAPSIHIRLTPENLAKIEELPSEAGLYTFRDIDSKYIWEVGKLDSGDIEFLCRTPGKFNESVWVSGDELFKKAI